MNIASNFLTADLETLVIVLLATVVRGRPLPGDDLCELQWVGAAGKLPDMAFQADRYIIERYLDGSIEAIRADPAHSV